MASHADFPGTKRDLQINDHIDAFNFPRDLVEKKLDARILDLVGGGKEMPQLDGVRCMYRYYILCIYIYIHRI